MPHQNPSDNSGTLPTSIEALTPEYIRANLATWDKKIEQMLAELHLAEEPAESSDKPMFMVRAEAEAAAEGVPVKVLLQQYLKGLRDSNYPTRECLFPDEVAEYTHNDNLPDDRLRHAEICDACTTLLVASLPVAAYLSGGVSIQGSVDDLLFSTQKTVRQAIPEESPTVTVKTSTQTTRARHLVTNLIAGTLPGIVVAILGTAIVIAVEGGKAVTPVTAPSNRLYGAALFGLWLVFITIFRGFTAVRLARLVLSSCMVGVFVAVCIYINCRQSEASVSMAFHWAEDRTELVALSAIIEKSKTGKYPTAGQLSGIVRADKDLIGTLNVSEPQATDGGAIYVITAPQFPGEIIAELGTGNSNLEWKNGNKVLKRVEIVPGTIEATPANDTEQSGVAVNAEGRTYKYNNPDPSGAPTPGEVVIAAVDRDTSSFKNYRVVTYVPHSVPKRSN